MTQETLDEIINNSEFSECIADAAPHRVKIIETLAPKMKELQNDYVEMMVKADYLSVADILAKLKLDKKDAEAKAEYAKWRKKVMDEFHATLKAIHPNEGQTPSVGSIYLAGRMLNYIGRSDIVTAVLQDKNITMKFSDLADGNEYFANPDTKAMLVDIFQQADETQGEICENADKIKKDIYDMLPTELKFDSKTNKRGLKQANFCALVRHKAMGMIKDQDKYTKYINAQIENNNCNIDREEIMMGKTKQM